MRERGRKKKKKRSQKKGKAGGEPGDAAGRSDEEPSHGGDEATGAPVARNVKRDVKVDSLSFLPFVNGFKFDFGVNYLPDFRKEYPDPTIKPKFSVPKVPPNFNVGHNIWLAKPSGFCRGRGIEIFTDLSSLKEDLPRFLQGYNDWENLEITEDKKKYYGLVGGAQQGRPAQQHEGYQAEVEQPGPPEVPRAAAAAGGEEVRPPRFRAGDAPDGGLRFRVPAAHPARATCGSAPR